MLGVDDWVSTKEWPPKCDACQSDNVIEVHVKVICLNCGASRCCEDL